MKIAFIGHSFHQQTKSSEFFLRLLPPEARIDFYWDESWQKDEHNIDYAALAEWGYDLILVWQQHKTVEILVNDIGYDPDRILFVPMYDGCHALPDAFWKKIRKVRILSFCRVLQQRFEYLGMQSRYFQYYPDPRDYKLVENARELCGFFWQRKQQLTWHQISGLIDGNHFASFHLHGAVDPGCSELIRPTDDEIARYHISFSDWFKDHAEYFSCLRKANLFVAPRIEEGIGLSFLEAMAMGMAVVAANRPTMNEYLTHRVNGYLFEPDQPRKLDLRNFREAGKRARQSVEVGHRRWSRQVAEMLDYVLRGENNKDPVVAFPKDKEQRRTQRELNSPLVTVAMVVYNAKETFTDTLKNIASQTYPNLEIVVVDGASTDGTTDLICANEQYIDRWISEKDQGIYNAMNKAARLARGKWILFMGAGDGFLDNEVVADSLRQAPADADFIYGHHVYRPVNGIDEWHKANDFGETWNIMRAGNLTPVWLMGVPCHQATFTNVELLCRYGYDTKLRITADHDFMYRMKTLDAKFYHADTTMALYHGGGHSAQNTNRCINEWLLSILPHTEDKERVRVFFYRLKKSWGVPLTWHERVELFKRDWQEGRYKPKARTLLEMLKKNWREFMRWFFRVNLCPAKCEYKVTVMGIKVMDLSSPRYRKLN
jgi:glycosyltransferase involved in cell wall biosynthesis